MKKTLMSVVILFMLVGTLVNPAQAYNMENINMSVMPADGKIKFETLPANNKLAGSYDAVFCNEGVSWSDSGQVKSFLGFYSSPKVYISYLGGCKGKTGLTLSATKGNVWVWVAPTLFTDGYYKLQWSEKK